MFSIAFPQQGKPVLLFKKKFAACGVAGANQYPLKGILIGTGVANIAKGQIKRQPDGTRTTWTMVFDLSDVDYSQTYSLTIYQHNKDGTSSALGNPLDGIKFQDISSTAKKGGEQPGYVTIAWPTTGTTGICKSTFSPYGGLVSPDTDIQNPATLSDDTTTNTMNPEVYQDSDPSGFWVASFDNVAGNSGDQYTLTVTGYNSGVPEQSTGLQFANC